MKQNYRGNKKRIEETKKKRKEAKLNKRLLNKKEDGTPLIEGEAAPVSPETDA